MNVFTDLKCLSVCATVRCTCIDSVSVTFFQILTISATPGAAADFAGGALTNTVTIDMDQPTVEIPLPLNDDTAAEADETFLCFITSATAGVTNGRVTLTIQDDDSLSKWVHIQEGRHEEWFLMQV